jgi:hypothetical protein
MRLATQVQKTQSCYNYVTQRATTTTCPEGNLCTVHLPYSLMALLTRH